MKKKMKSNCEFCQYYDYDEEMDSYVCTLDLDEDEMERYAFSERSCPFYQFHDEYINVRKQI